MCWPKVKREGETITGLLFTVAFGDNVRQGMVERTMKTNHLQQCQPVLFTLSQLKHWAH